jgi:glutamate synthase (ferredoxin)
VGDFERRCNRDMVDLEPLSDEEDAALVLMLIRKHSEYTQSSRAAKVVASWDVLRPKFVKVMPRDYRRVLTAQAKAKAEGRDATWSELLGVQHG